MTTEAFDYSKLDHPAVLQMLFHPRKDSGSSPPANATDYDITLEEGIKIGARFYMADGKAPNILFFHGNGEIVEDYDPVGPIYNEYGLSFLAVDYRGYGRSGGVPTASTMLSDAHHIFKDVQKWLKSEGRTGPLLAMGRSLGSACALELAASYGEEMAGIVIESGFALTVPLLQCLGVDTESVGISEAQGFKNIQKIEQFSKPTLIIHARNDQIIPIASAELLQVHSAARSKEFHMIPGADHNTIMIDAGKTYFELIKRFTDKIQGIRPKRRSFRQRRKDRLFPKGLVDDQGSRV